MSSLSSIEKWLANPQNGKNKEKEFIVPRFGEDNPITIRPIIDSEYQEALSAADKARKNNAIGASSLFMKKICLMGMVNPNLNRTDLIELANNNVQKANAELIKELDEKYEKELKAWEKTKDPDTKPEKQKPVLLKNISTPQNLLENWFLAGEIIQIGEKILEISGFGITLEEATKEAKN